MVGTVGTLTDLCSLLSMYSWPATNITAANTITNVALANCVTSLICFTNVAHPGRYSPRRTLDPGVEFQVTPAL